MVIVHLVYMLKQESILKQIRENGKKEGTIESFLYNLLSTAHPNMIEMIEKQAVEMKKMGQVMGQEMMKAEEDPQTKAKFMSLFERVSQNFSTTPEEKDDIPEM